MIERRLAQVGDVTLRAPTDPAVLRRRTRVRRRKRRTAFAIVAVGCAVIIAVLVSDVLVTSSPERRRVSADAADRPSTVRVASATAEVLGPISQEHIPPGEATIVASDTGLLAWGGEIGGGGLTASGAVYDAARDEWRTMAPSPLSPRTWAAGAWTGSELVIVGGIGPGRLFTNSAAAYDPARDAWRSLPPLPARVVPSDPIDLLDSPVQQVVWTGTTVVIPQLALELKLDETEWRRFADRPRTLARVETASDDDARRVLLIASEDIVGPTRSHAFEIDVRRGRFTRLPTLPIVNAGLSAIAVPDGWLVVNTSHEAARYDRREDRWIMLPPVPAIAQNCETSAFRMDGVVLVDVCSAMAALNGDDWTPVTLASGNLDSSGVALTVPDHDIVVVGIRAESNLNELTAIRLQVTPTTPSR